MTDKQIIIDGIDVSGCKYYLFREQQPNGERCCGMGLVDCNGNDCLYKKYKRKEQECEELKNERTVDLVKQLDQLKAEVKSKTEYIQEQRDIINQYSKEIEMYKKCQGKRASKREEELKAENKHLNDLLNQALKDYDKARQTLTEIKEIVSIGLVDGLQTEEYSVFLKILQAQILQKISECEGNNDKG